MFGLANLGMYRRAMSTDPALVRQSHEDGYRLVKPRTSRVGRSRERNIVPPNNQELEQRISVRRSERTVLHPARHDRVCSPSGDACTYSVEGNSGLAMIRYATPIVINTRTAAIQRRLQLADLAAYHGLQTSAHTMLVERTITSTADLNVVEQWEMEKKAQVVSKTEQKQKAVVHISSIHGRTDLGFSQVVEGESKSTCAVGGEHIPRDRTRLNAPQQKGQVRMMRGVSTTPLNGLPSVRSERRFRESVTRRERGGDSLKRELNTERNQTRQIALKELRKPNPPTNLFLKEQKRVIDSTSVSL
uniref:Uncharacterized protein n=2 Tax=Parascaris univalens TaxID=6257 RepID=A0A914ZZC0_PARUN